MPTAPFPIQPELTAIAIGYRNTRLIADNVLPRIPVGKREFKYLVYNLADGFTVPDTRVGRKGKVNEVEFQATELTASADDYGLEDPIPQDDITNAPPNYDPVGRAVEGITDLILLDREIRVAGLVFNAATYVNKVTLSGTSQFSDFANSDPIATIHTALDSCLMRPNVMTIGRPAFSVLCRHPKLCKAIFGNNTDVGIVTANQVAQLFELDEVLIGEAYLNTAKKGQAVALSRVWGKHIALTYRDRNATTRGRMSFGYTCQFGSRLAGAWEDKNIGLRGGHRVRMGESVKELICAPDLGYFIQNAVV
ncbi:MAG: hypothetical protein LBD10_14750 [Desulfobulbus sp.]|jgi:hypothetical protein|uniref:hypothetical protein n=1 Tax=Desulfobulbus sp. TaxID=895 RepID=UPI00284F3349|nr:hypothetical protein [Desulfobulbus sp.]MDR2551447.1 hypothetical protein [Desulfobulbus sp.]